MITFLTILIFIILGTAMYVILNLLKKLERLESILENNTEKYVNIYNSLKEIDLRGSFESDDEVGSTFKDIKTLIEKNIDHLNGN